MPLPYAPPPKESKVYTDLKNLKITGITADQIDTLKGELYAQGVDGSEDEMRRLNLVSETANVQSQSGPIAGGGKYVEVPVSSTGHTLVFQPDPGEVYVMMAGQINNTGSESFSASLSLHTDPASFSQGVPIDTGISGTSNQAVDMLNSPVYVSNELVLTTYFGTVGASGNEVRIMLHRVR